MHRCSLGLETTVNKRLYFQVQVKYLPGEQVGFGLSWIWSNLEDWISFWVLYDTEQKSVFIRLYNRLTVSHSSAC